MICKFYFYLHGWTLHILIPYHEEVKATRKIGEEAEAPRKMTSFVDLDDDSNDVVSAVKFS